MDSCSLRIAGEALSRNFAKSIRLRDCSCCNGLSQVISSRLNATQSEVIRMLQNGMMAESRR